MPPFRADDDPDIREAVNWLLSFADQGDWVDRLASIGQRLSDASAQSSNFRQVGYDQQDWPDDDRMAWYVYLAQAALDRPFDYEPREGCRVLPIFKRFGMHLPELRTVNGVQERVRRLLAKGTTQPDPILFELLVALLWKLNGFKDVEFLSESAKSKTPDLRASNGSDEWFVECKRLDRHSRYTREERTKWRSMWSRLSERLLLGRHSVVLDIRFHVELSGLPDDYLATQLPGKLKLVRPPTHLVANNTLDVFAFPVDYFAANRHLDRYWVRCPSDQLDELVGGKRDPNRGFSAIVAGRFELFERASFLSRLSYAAGAFWDCDAPAAVLAKARHVRSRVANAIDQLPGAGKGAVHVGIETVDGALVEEARSVRNRNNISAMSGGDKDLRCVYCHLLQFYAPPRGNWVVDETVEHSSTEPTHPLRSLGVFPTDEPQAKGGRHWRRPPP